MPAKTEILDFMRPTSMQERNKQMREVPEAAQETMRTEDGSTSGIQGLNKWSFLQLRTGLDGTFLGKIEWTGKS